MKYNRHSIRLDNFDYANNGYYFVTVCCQNKLKLFWKNKKIFNQRADTSVRPYIESDQISRPYIKSNLFLNNIGLMIDYWFGEISNHFKNVILDEYVIMPDHIHIIVIIEKQFNYCINDEINIRAGININIRATTRVAPTLGTIIGELKSIITNEYIKNVKNNNWSKFNKRLWQRNYYERIIRNENEYLKTKEYIKNNPKN